MVRFFGQFVKRALDFSSHCLSGHIAGLYIDFLVKHIIGNLKYNVDIVIFKS
jgi:hypothetical protein